MSSVYESVGLGIPSIVSNIDINLELQSHNIDNLCSLNLVMLMTYQKIVEAEDENFCFQMKFYLNVVW